MSQQHYNQHVGADMAAGQTSSSVELGVVVSASEERGHEAHECVWNGAQPWVGIELPRSQQEGTPAQRTKLIQIGSNQRTLSYISEHCSTQLSI